MLLIRSHFKNELNYQHPRLSVLESTFILKDLILPNWMLTSIDFPYFLKRIQDYEINIGIYYFYIYYSFLHYRFYHYY